jgi:ubiquinone/menaquinone biosynthesis C-methylase UbiE
MSKEIKQTVESYYKNSYAMIHGDSRLRLADKIFHKELERYSAPNLNFENVLEIGSGNYEHLPHVQHAFKTYTCVDLREPTRPTPKSVGKTSFVKADATSLPFPDSSFDRVLSTCLLMHLNDPVGALEEWARVLKPGGILEFMVPCEPGVALTTFQRLFSEPNARTYGISEKTYRLVTAYDHVSSFPRIKTLFEACFKEGTKIRYFPFNWLPNYNLNAFAIFRVEKPHASKQSVN